MLNFVKKGYEVLTVKNVVQGHTAGGSQIHDLNPRLFESRTRGTKKVGVYLKKHFIASKKPQNCCPCF